MRDTPTRPASFQPRFTLSLLYLFVLFFVYALLLVSPELSEIARPASPAEEEAVKQAATEVARRVAAPRLLLALALSVGTVLLGSRQGWLPGMRPSR